MIITDTRITCVTIVISATVTGTNTKFIVTVAASGIVVASIGVCEMNDRPGYMINEVMSVPINSRHGNKKACETQTLLTLLQVFAKTVRTEET